MPSPGFNRFSGPWHGEDQVVVGIDIGTTHSGVAFTYLTKGVEQHLYRVTHWPGQDPKSGAKVPSVVWYDSNGKAASFGAEALAPEAEERAVDNGWELARYFKLYLHPQDLQAKYTLELEPLPTGVPLSRIYSNFLNYLLTHTQRAFESTIVGNAKAIWARHRSKMIFVITHPNGWGLGEQAFLRDAAIGAGLTTRENPHDQLRFVTEAEASTYFCLHFSEWRDSLSPGMNFIVCDAGGSTVDIALYSAEQVSPELQLGEALASVCIQAGGIFVDKTAKSYLERLFEDAGVSADQVDEYVTEGANDFELQGKRRFENTDEETRVKVAGVRHDRESPPIRRGQLKLSRLIVRSFFDPYVNEILASVSSQVSSKSVSHILLVGGFGESLYLYQQLKDRFEPMGCLVTRTVEPSSKASSDGAVIWHCASIRLSSSHHQPPVHARTQGRHEQKPASVLVMGRSGSGKTQLITQVCDCCDGEYSGLVTANQGTMDPRPHRIPLSGGSSLEVVDTPGLDNVNMSDLEVFTKVAMYLRDPTRIDRGLARIVYIHPAGDTIQSRTLQQNLRTILDLFAAAIEGIRLTVLVVPRGTQGVDPSTVVEGIRRSSLPVLREAVGAGASILAATASQDLFGEFLRSYALQPPVRPPISALECDLRDPRPKIEFHLKNSWGDREKQLADTRISSYEKKLVSYEKEMSELQASTTRYQKKYQDTMLRNVDHQKTEASLRQQLQDLKPDSFESKLRQLHAEQEEGNTKLKQYRDAYERSEQLRASQRVEERALRQQLQQTQQEYSSLRSQLQLQDNFEQGEPVQELKDINRDIGDIGRSVSTHLADTYVQAIFGKTISEVTSLDARNLPELKSLLRHVDGMPSLISSSKGVGMDIESFFDFSVRTLLCNLLVTKTFFRFHPAIHPSYDQVLRTTYLDIQKQEPQLVAGKWRSRTFKSVYKPEKPEITEAQIDNLVQDFMCGRLAPFMTHFFGQKDLVLGGQQVNRLRQLIKRSWGWHSKLKGEVIMLGDFRLTAYAPCARFDPRWMEEFEPNPSKPKAKTILGTLALGLISQRAVGGGRSPEETIVCKALVASNNLYD